MTDASLLVWSVAGFLGGMLVISRTLGWLAGLLALRHRSASKQARRSWPVQLFLHSGPWLLALAVAIFVHVASLPWPTFAALCGGFGLAMLIVVAVTGSAIWRRRHPARSPNR